MDLLLEGAAAFRYSLVALYLRIQTAAAYAMMAKQTEAAALLQETLQEAKMDGLVLPFAENYRYLKPLLAAGAQTLPVTWVHACAVAALPQHHADPFDRLLIAQAGAERLTLVSVDRQFRAYDVALLDD